MDARIDDAILHRKIVRISAGAGHAIDRCGIARSYSLQYDTVKVAFVDETGRCTGKFTDICLCYIEF